MPAESEGREPRAPGRPSGSRGAGAVGPEGGARARKWPWAGLRGALGAFRLENALLQFPLAQDALLPIGREGGRRKEKARTRACSKSCSFQFCFAAAPTSFTF